MERSNTSRHAPDGRTALISRAMQIYNNDISAMSKNRLAGSSLLKDVGGGYVFYCVGKNEGVHGQSAVGLAIKSKLA